MQISQQWRPVEAEQGGVEEIQVRLKQEKSTDLASFIEITEVIANSTSKCNSRLKIRLLSEVRQKPP
ncbi:hypothetical protein, partial [Aeromonas rivipollensis]|uniref:hypothetical protein n=1 Tax=Aeromonas rivipollensis TaxID=948519 RepID=UPI003D211501